KGRLSSSSDTVSLYSGDTVQVRAGYVDNYIRFQLNESGTTAMNSILNHLLKKEDETTEVGKRANIEKRTMGNEVIAPQVISKISSLDPTERAAALVIAAHLTSDRSTMNSVPDTDGKIKNFSEKFLGYIDYGEICLNGFNFSNADFFNAGFQSSSFKGANLNRAKFERCTFKGETNLSEINKVPVLAKEVQREGVNFNGAQFDGKATFNDSDLTRSSFDRAPTISEPAGTVLKFGEEVTTFFNEVEFVGGRLDNCSFSGAVFKNAKFTEITVDQPQDSSDGQAQYSINFGSAGLEKATKFLNVTILNCNFPKSNFEGASVGVLAIAGHPGDDNVKSKFNDCNFAGITASPTISRITFSNIDLSRSRFSPTTSESVVKGADLKMAAFDSCVLDNVHFGSAIFSERSTLTAPATLSGTVITGSSGQRGSLKGCTGKGTVFGPDETNIPSMENCEFTEGSFLGGVKDPELIKTVKLEYSFVSSEIAEQYTSKRHTFGKVPPGWFLLVVKPLTSDITSFTISDVLTASPTEDNEYITNPKPKYIVETLRGKLVRLGLLEFANEAAGEAVKLGQSHIFSDEEINTALKARYPGITIVLPSIY
ncbi:MAG: pentapeptide repeat-containing protein, partial [Verrucomicrobiales bacterium]|nr:pentapeptide repeat-containing protein [Verrucomicrobiales bacterium]